MGVKVTFLKEAETDATANTRPVMLVPKAAIRTDSGQTYAFVVGGNNVVDRRAVKVGGNDGDRLEVEAGLTRGDRVILSPPQTLQSGTTVAIKQGG
jgi:multidrug efflux pump subunit AcrA (membrane-fusion protein)